MKIEAIKIGERQFLMLDDTSIPIDRIRAFDFQVANGGASGRSVKIVTDDPNDDYIYAFENRDAILEFLIDQKIVNGRYFQTQTT